jgi:hypothetical protein
MEEKFSLQKPISIEICIKSKRLTMIASTAEGERWSYLLPYTVRELLEENTDEGETADIKVTHMFTLCRLPEKPKEVSKDE